MKFTKIVATISDKHCSPEFISQLYCAGMNVVRINSAHATPESFRLIVDSVRAVSDSIAVMIDTKGPEIRTTAVAPGLDKVAFDRGDRVRICGNPEADCDHEVINVNYPGIVDDVPVGAHMLIDDGTLDFEIVDRTPDALIGVSCNRGLLGSRKSVNLPGVAIDLPSVSERDRRFIALAVELGVDFIAHSFVRSRADVEAVQRILDDCGSTIKIISKIENQQGVDNFDDILDASYGIMVARGDLGIEIPAERIPAIQRMMISKCIAGHKPVIVATQMLHSMINNPRPTRAEVSDVAEAAYQQADALMLSGETAAGLYPVEAVATMARIASEVEDTIAKAPNDAPALPDAHVTSFLARQAVMSEIKVRSKAIITDAFHGRTARFISSFRGSQPVFAICNKPEVARRLALSYGISPYLYAGYSHTQRYPVEAMQQIVADGFIRADDRITYLGSLGGNGATFLEVNTVADIVAYTNNPESSIS